MRNSNSKFISLCLQRMLNAYFFRLQRIFFSFLLAKNEDFFRFPSSLVIVSPQRGEEVTKTKRQENQGVVVRKPRRGYKITKVWLQDNQSVVTRQPTRGYIKKRAKSEITFVLAFFVL